MNHRISPRVWALLGVGIAVVVGIGLLLAFLGREPGEPSSMITPAARSSPDDPVVASVDGRPIHQSVWMEAVLLDQVMSGMAGQPAPSTDETLNRLIDQELVLEGFPPEQEPTAGQIEAQITALERTWGVGDDAMVTALEQIGLTRAQFEREIGRLLTVQASLEALESQGHEPTDWLEEQRASADIVINEEFLDVAVPHVPIAQALIATPESSPLPTPRPTAAPSILSPLPLPATEMPSPDPVVAIPEIGPDFTLEQSGGGTRTLSEQLAQGPVVLVFFQRGGG
jgi:hypothetical protein